MKPIVLRIGVALLAFFLGVVASTIRSWFFVGSPQSPHLAMSSRDEEWHRLYEAAGMTGDSEIRAEVTNRLRCTNKAGVPDGWLIDLDYEQWCRRADGSMHQLLENETSEYGSFFKRITSSHYTWTMENLDFVRTISTAKQAKEYVAIHEWLLFKEARLR